MKNHTAWRPLPFYRYTKYPTKAKRKIKNIMYDMAVATYILFIELHT